MAPIETKFNVEDGFFPIVNERARQCPTCLVTRPKTGPWESLGAMNVREIAVGIDADGADSEYWPRDGERPVDAPYSFVEGDCFATEAEAQAECDRRNAATGPTDHLSTEPVSP